MRVLVFIYLCLKVLKMCINSCSLEEESIIIKKPRAKKKKNNPNSKITSTDVTIVTLGCMFSLKKLLFICINSVKKVYFKS